MDNVSSSIYVKIEFILDTRTGHSPVILSKQSHIADQENITSAISLKAKHNKRPAVSCCMVLCLTSRL